DSEFESGPVEIPLGDKVWSVHNYENSDLGRISLATATEGSDNTVSAQLTQLVGPNNIVRTARRLGITSPLKSYFAIGLGAEAVNPLEMARAFSAFANGGPRVDGGALGDPPLPSPLKSYFAIGLGAEAVNPLEMARAFSAFANGGRRIDGAAFGNRPRAISVVRDDADRI